MRMKQKKLLLAFACLLAHANPLEMSTIREIDSLVEKLKDTEHANIIARFFSMHKMLSEQNPKITDQSVRQLCRSMREINYNAIPNTVAAYLEEIGIGELRCKIDQTFTTTEKWLTLNSYQALELFPTTHHTAVIEFLKSLEKKDFEEARIGFTKIAYDMKKSLNDAARKLITKQTNHAKYTEEYCLLNDENMELMPQYLDNDKEIEKYCVLSHENMGLMLQYLNDDKEQLGLVAMLETYFDYVDEVYQDTSYAKTLLLSACGYAAAFAVIALPVGFIVAKLWSQYGEILQSYLKGFSDLRSDLSNKPYSCAILNGSSFEFYDANMKLLGNATNNYVAQVGPNLYKDSQASPNWMFDATTGVRYYYIDTQTGVVKSSNYNNQTNSLVLKPSVGSIYASKSTSNLYLAPYSSAPSKSMLIPTCLDGYPECLDNEIACTKGLQNLSAPFCSSDALTPSVIIPECINNLIFCKDTNTNGMICEYNNGNQKYNCGNIVVAASGTLPLITHLITHLITPSTKTYFKMTANGNETSKYFKFTNSNNGQVVDEISISSMIEIGHNAYDTGSVLTLNTLTDPVYVYFIDTFAHSFLTSILPRGGTILNLRSGSGIIYVSTNSMQVILEAKNTAQAKQMAIPTCTDGGPICSAEKPICINNMLNNVGTPFCSSDGITSTGQNVYCADQVPYCPSQSDTKICDNLYSNIYI